jgi:hypothetical protein
MERGVFIQRSMGPRLIIGGSIGADVAGDVGMDILGPSLSDEELRQIIAEADVS